MLSKDITCLFSINNRSVERELLGKGIGPIAANYKREKCMKKSAGVRNKYADRFTHKYTHTNYNLL